MKLLVYSIFFIAILSTSCSERRAICDSPLKIAVNSKSADIIDATEYFKKPEIIRLETSKKSMIYDIDRVYFYNDSIYILDRKQQSIFAFAPNGMFLRKICHTGKGPGEYIQIFDFTIDEKNKEVVVSSETPKAVFKYDLNGNFIKSFPVNNCYCARISTIGDKVILAGITDEYDCVLHEFGNPTGTFIKSSVEKCANSYSYPHIGSYHPNLVKSNGSFYNQPLGREIYAVGDGIGCPRYKIDFGSGNLPTNIKGGLEDIEFFKFYDDDKYKYLINGFRVNKEFIFFSFEPAMYTLYNKQSKKSKVFEGISDDYLGFNIYNISPHDGTYNGIVSIMDPIDFIKKVESLKKNRTEEKQIGTIELCKDIKENDNPILFKYAFK